MASTGLTATARTWITISRAPALGFGATPTVHRPRREANHNAWLDVPALSPVMPQSRPR